MINSQAWIFGGLLIAASIAASAQTHPKGPSSGYSAKGPHHVYLVGNLLVTEPQISFETGSPDQATGSFSIENRGWTVERLVKIESKQADKIIFDANGDEPGIGDGTLVIPARQTMLLKSDGVHLRFEGLHRKDDEQFVPTVLTFKQAGPLHLDFMVQGR